MNIRLSVETSCCSLHLVDCDLSADWLPDDMSGLSHLETLDVRRTVWNKAHAINIKLAPLAALKVGHTCVI